MKQLLEDEYRYTPAATGDVRQGVVVAMHPHEIVVDIGGKKEGVVPQADLEKLDPGVLANISVGAQVPVYVVRAETYDSGAVLSLNLAQSQQDWLRAAQYLESGEVFEAKVLGHNKGGLLVGFGQLRGFVPASQVVSRPANMTAADAEWMPHMINMTLPFKVIEVDQRRRRLILSERLARRVWRKMQKGRLLAEIAEGQTRRGTVSNLAEFGAFVDLGGVDGLVHVSELAWRRVRHPSEVLRVGQEVEVYVLRVDREKERIALSLKRLQTDPWTAVTEKYRLHQVVEAVVTNVTNFGVFAEIEPGLEGLIHISELTDQTVSNPREVVSPGERLMLEIISLDPARRRIGLSRRRVQVVSPAGLVR